VRDWIQCINASDNNPSSLSQCNPPSIYLVISYIIWMVFLLSKHLHCSTQNTIVQMVQNKKGNYCTKKGAKSGLIDTPKRQTHTRSHSVLTNSEETRSALTKFKTLSNYSFLKIGTVVTVDIALGKMANCTFRICNSEILFFHWN